MNWWVTQGDRQPVGPVSTELLLEGIAAGMIPWDALVCEEGGSQWKWIGNVAPFTEAIAKHKPRRSDPDGEHVTLDEPRVSPPQSEAAPKGDRGVLPRRFDENAERTVAERPFFPSDEPLHRFDNAGENTIVDAEPLRPSEPPK